MPIGQSRSLLVYKQSEEQDEVEERPPEYMTITRRIRYAGQVTEVQEEVLRDSDAARQYLAEQEELDREKAEQGDDEGIVRPLRRFSLFEPNPLGNVKGLAADRPRKAPSRVALAMAETQAERKRRADKVTTMQKSALDWKGFVDEQGLGEELDKYGKSNSGYLAREQFLDKVHGAKEMARRTARLRV